MDVAEAVGLARESRDEEALGFLWDKYKGYVFKIACKFVGGDGYCFMDRSITREDLVQRGYYCFLRAIDRVDLSKGHFSTYFYRGLYMSFCTVASGYSRRVQRAHDAVHIFIDDEESLTEPSYEYDYVGNLFVEEVKERFPFAREVIDRIAYGNATRKDVYAEVPNGREVVNRLVKGVKQIHGNRRDLL